jgi:hypothetical protein
MSAATILCKVRTYKFINEGSEHMQVITVNIDEATFVSSTLPDTNFSTSPVIYTGTEATFGDCISYLKFTIPPLPVTSVTSALLNLAVIVKTGDSPSPVVVNRVTSNFDIGTVTYNMQPTFEATASAVDVTTEDVLNVIKIDVTNLVNQWLNGTYENMGIALTNTDGMTAVAFTTNEIMYEPFFPVLVITYSETPPVDEAEPYAYIFNNEQQIINVDEPVLFNQNGALLNISHNVGEGKITIEKDGTYAVWFSVNAVPPNQFALFQNDNLVPGSIYGVEHLLVQNTGSFREDSNLSPNSPYSASKASADLLALSFAHTYGMPVIITRCCNNYGPYQNTEKFIPACITNVLNNKPIPLYGNGTNVREWIHVLDHCTAIIRTLFYGRPGEIYNIGTGVEVSNINMAKKILKLLGKPEDFIEYVKDRPGHDFRYSVNCEKLRKETCWSCKLNLDDGLRDTIQWYKDNRDWWEK